MYHITDIVYVHLFYYHNSTGCFIHKRIFTPPERTEGLTLSFLKLQFKSLKRNLRSIGQKHVKFIVFFSFKYSYFGSINFFIPIIILFLLFYFFDNVIAVPSLYI